MVANTHTYRYFYTAVPDMTDYGTLIAVPYKKETGDGFRYNPGGDWRDRGDLIYSNVLGDWWEHDFTKGVRLTHKGGFEGIGVDIYLDNVLQSRQYLYNGEVYFEVHPNTATTKTVRVVLADKTNQEFLLQTGLDIWV